MEIIHYKDWRGNFGDDLNIPFFEATAPAVFEARPSTRLYGIGTLLNSNFERIQNAIILGSGAGYGTTVDWDPATVRVLGVRGPLTAKSLGMENEPGIVIGDPALLAPHLPSLLGGKDLGIGNIVVAPHHKTAECWDLRPLSKNGLYYLDPGITTVPDYIATIRAAPLVLTESLHGAILASAFGIPFIPIALCADIDPTKWIDFYHFLSIAPVPAIPCPLSVRPLLRRVFVAGARSVLGRKFGLAKSLVHGFHIPMPLADAMTAQLLDLATGRAPVVANHQIIARSQDRIAAACHKLRSMVS